MRSQQLRRLQYTTSDWTLADTEYDRVRRALDEDHAFRQVNEGLLQLQLRPDNTFGLGFSFVSGFERYRVGIGPQGAQHTRCQTRERVPGRLTMPLAFEVRPKQGD